MSLPAINLPQIDWQTIHPDDVGVAGYIDVETTGLSPASEEIIELAIALFAYDLNEGSILGIVDNYTGLREPSKRIPQRAIRVHGITDDIVRGQKLDSTRIMDLMGRAQFLVAHNAPFDRGFVSRLFPVANEKPWMCSMRDIDWYGRGYSSRGLQPLLSAHSIHVAQAHRGEADVRAALALLRQEDRSGTQYFGELLHKYSERYGYPSLRKAMEDDRGLA